MSDGQRKTWVVRWTAGTEEHEALVVADTLENAMQHVREVNPEMEKTFSLVFGLTVIPEMAWSFPVERSPR
jgi:hypothetical protein